MIGSLIFVLGYVETWWSDEVESSISRIPEVRSKWANALSDVDESLREDLSFLVEFLPREDLAVIDPAALIENASLAKEARDSVPWGADLPRDIYLNEVLPHRSATEPFHPMRREFYERYLPLVKDAPTPGEAALRLNARLFEDYGVVYNVGRRRTDQSSMESIEQGMATCTGLSIMFVEAARAVGIPARIAGIASWPGRGGNHTWAEVWSDGWHFLGAAEPDDRGLNHAWFVGDAATAIHSEPMNAVWAASYRSTGEQFPLAWNLEASVNGVNVTDRYAGEREDTRPRLMVEVRDSLGRLEAPVMAFSLETGELVLDGTSLGPQSDMNLHLSEHVDTGEYLVLAFVDSVRVGAIARVGESDEVVRIVTESASDPLETVIAQRFGSDDEARSAAARILAAVPFDDIDMETAWVAFKDAPENVTLRDQFEEKRVRTPDRESPYLWRHVGEKPEEGWALVIAMHGGGATATEFNDRAWQGMFDSYYRDQPDAGGYIYLALRAPNDEWNGFYDNAISPLVEELIFQFVLFADVDPNAVYILGASHGGYGAFVIGPKIPYRFAAAHSSAAAPTDGMTRGENLRNTPFTWMIGENDTAHGRDWRCKAFAEDWDKWREAYGGFEGGMEWLPGVGHSVPDRDKVADLLRTGKRNTTPSLLVWSQSDSVLTEFFWLQTPGPSDGNRIEARIADNRIDISAEGIDRVVLWLQVDQIDPSRPIVVVLNGEEQEFEAMPSLEDYCTSLEIRRDPHLAAPIRIEVSADSD